MGIWFEDQGDVTDQWFAEMGDLRLKYQLRDNAGENISREIKAFFTSKGVKNCFSTP
jgi:hypothetical protein